MSFPAREPNVHVGCRIGIAADQAHDASLVVVCFQQAIHNGSKFQWDHVNVHSQLAQIVLNDRGHLRALRVRGARQNGKLDRGAL